MLYRQGVYNILDYAAVSFPTGITADKELDQGASQTEALSKVDQQIQNECRLLLLVRHCIPSLTDF